jgi:hypothetical protein
VWVSTDFLNSHRVRYSLKRDLSVNSTFTRGGQINFFLKAADLKSPNFTKYFTTLS